MDFIFHIIIKPLSYAMGWLLVYTFTLGRVRPTEATFSEKPIVMLLGLLTWLALPSLIVILWRAIVSWF